MVGKGHILDPSELIDLGFSGPRFTWRGMRNNALVQERLDRGLVNAKWQIQWPNTTVVHGTVKASDRCPLIINTDPATVRGQRLFCFKAFWTKEE